MCMWLRSESLWGCSSPHSSCSSSMRGGNQHFEQAQALARQMYRLAFHRHRVLGRIVFDGFVTHPAIHHAAAAAGRQRVQPRLDLAQRERLDQVIVGAAIEGGELVIQHVPRRQDQDRHILPCLAPQLAAKAQAIDAGQAEVEHDGVEVAGYRQVHAGDSVARQINEVAPPLEEFVEVGGDVEVVLDDQDAHGRRFY